MLITAPVSFHISKTIFDCDSKKIEATKREFNEILIKIKEDERFNNLVFLQGIPYVRHPKKSQEELDGMKKELEENGYRITKMRKKLKIDDFEICQLRWKSCAQPETIRELIKKWNEIDQGGSPNCFILRCDGNAFGMFL